MAFDILLDAVTTARTNLSNDQFQELLHLMAACTALRRLRGLLIRADLS
jgi:hypothetical protein